MENFSYTIICENYDKDTIDLFISLKNFIKNIYVLNEDSTSLLDFRINHKDNKVNNTSYYQYILNNSNTDYFILIPKSVTVVSNNFIDDVNSFFNLYNEYEVISISNKPYILSKDTYKDFFNGILVIKKEVLINIPIIFINNNIDTKYLGYLLYKGNYKNHLLVDENIDIELVINHDKIDCTDNTLIIPFKNNYSQLEKTIWEINEYYENLKIILIDNLSNNRIADINKIIKLFDNVKYYRVNNNYGEIYSIEYGVDNIKTKYVIFYEGNNLNIKFIQNVINNEECSINNNLIKINKRLYNSILRSDGLNTEMDILFILMKVDKIINENFNIDDFIKEYNVPDKTKKIIYKYIYDIK